VGSQAALSVTLPPAPHSSRSIIYPADRERYQEALTKAVKEKAASWSFKGRWCRLLALHIPSPAANALLQTLQPLAFNGGAGSEGGTPAAPLMLPPGDSVVYDVSAACWRVADEVAADVPALPSHPFAVVSGGLCIPGASP
jgi:hypothetical protein